jgi:hypothetical protein
MTLKEALSCARTRIAEGKRVMSITGPNGEKYDEADIARMLNPK